jgi:hypothetical protein
MVAIDASASRRPWARTGDRPPWRPAVVLLLGLALEVESPGALDPEIPTVR